VNNCVLLICAIISSISGVHDAIVRHVVTIFHVLVELILSVQSLVHSSAVQRFDVVTANGSGALGVPVVNVAFCSDG